MCSRVAKEGSLSVARRKKETHSQGRVASKTVIMFERVVFR